jgi:hypothetical protein
MVPPPLAPSRIIGVVGDLPDSVRIAADPTFYVVHPPSLVLVTVRMIGKDIPGTVKALAETCRRITAGAPYNSIWRSPRAHCGTNSRPRDPESPAARASAGGVCAVPGSPGGAMLGCTRGRF